jgi:hypothetical protein
MIRVWLCGAKKVSSVLWRSFLEKRNAAVASLERGR